MTTPRRRPVVHASTLRPDVAAYLSATCGGSYVYVPSSRPSAARQRRDRIIGLRLSAYTTRRIATEVGLTEGRVKTVLREAGVRKGDGTAPPTDRAGEEET